MIPERGAIVKPRKCERGLKRLLVRAGKRRRIQLTRRDRAAAGVTSATTRAAMVVNWRMASPSVIAVSLFAGLFIGHQPSFRS